MTSAPVLPFAHSKHVLGQLPDISSNWINGMSRLRQQYGDAVGFRLAQYQCMAVFHPELIEDVLVTSQRCFHKHFRTRLISEITGDGLITTEDDVWRRLRRMVQPSFHRKQNDAYVADMAQVVAAECATWQADEVREIGADMARITMAVVCRTLFALEGGSDEAAIVANALQEANECTGARLRGVPWPAYVPTRNMRRLRAAVKRIDTILLRMIQVRHAAGDAAERTDMLSVLLCTRDEKDGGSLSDKELRAQLMTIFVAGFESTAITLTWALALLAHSPETQDRVASESLAVLGDRLPTAEDLPKLRYARWVGMEALRLFPPIWSFGRECIQACQIGPYPVKPGTSVFVVPYVTHRDARFFPQPERFWPERWDGAQGQTAKNSWFPFGAGPRYCIGESFAMAEIILVLAYAVQRYRFELKGPMPVPGNFLTLRPGAPVKLRVERRAGPPSQV